eukprot:gnl/TRDRNA2_/TRDRNA2_126120_c0_seq1.p1 gnl/TRDRNA2_/TRDRNA2_126120_c0~~gnl/TRDRNA2_/TRDRNA2_126120_c0_seq1.p1  ORF type:complete len:117 (+),score=13.98 gnl/TRDRNA2_/TRDRNA2_126120_c0_seq1:328-678(+)
MCVSCVCMFVCVRIRGFVAGHSVSGVPGIDGTYVRTANSQDDVSVFEMDPFHQMYRFEGMWRLGDIGGEAIFYHSLADSTWIGPPKASDGWELGYAGQEPVPHMVTCLSGSEAIEV